MPVDVSDEFLRRATASALEAEYPSLEHSCPTVDDITSPVESAA